MDADTPAASVLIPVAHMVAHLVAGLLEEGKQYKRLFNLFRENVLLLADDGRCNRTSEFAQNPAVWARAHAFRCVPLEAYNHGFPEMRLRSFSAFLLT